MVSDRSAIAWLHRRAGFGLGPGELDRLERLGVDAVVDRLVDPGRHRVAVARDPWAGLNLATTDAANPGAALRRNGLVAVSAWLDALSSTPRPTESWLTWFWHGHFATSIFKVRYATMMVQHVRTLARLGPGRFPALLKGVTLDAAMLIWLDGRENSVQTPNENYGREVMELFALGVGNYTEADVKAAAAALSGWKLQQGNPVTSRFVPARHDAHPQRLLGRSGIRDVDGVVATLTANPACAPFLAGKLARAVLGEGADAGLVRDLGRRYRASGLDTRVLLRATLEAGLARLDGPAAKRPAVVVAPTPWLAAARRATGAATKPQPTLAQLRAAGQMPMLPPNVGGWPSGAAWLGTSTVVARFGLAGAVASATAASAPARRLAASGDDDALADLLCRPEGFGAATRAALADARRAGGPAGVAPLTIALASPDLTVA